MCLANVPVTSTKHESAKNTVSELWGHIKIGKLVSPYAALGFIIFLKVLLMGVLFRVLFRVVS